MGVKETGNPLPVFSRFEERTRPGRRFELKRSLRHFMRIIDLLNGIDDLVFTANITC
ncbi:hypothetical protein GCM10010918_05900 [Paenibacillus radicis (ex Gao et al. 2016)]|uniref:Uncharacterized protein n=1 Tax=Paenibacillus radicis (ex Gao et al. 2016) TaxID=1737354 RepID=A0A917GTC5_9BACL|nr:hypothetical protein GCM10010918_05900 [Paenibacillus radicis (ex Gao et al. 2016)]